MSVKDAETSRIQLTFLENLDYLRPNIFGEKKKKNTRRFTLTGPPVRKFALIADSGRSATELCQELHRQGRRASPYAGSHPAKKEVVIVAVRALHVRLAFGKDERARQATVTLAKGAMAEEIRATMVKWKIGMPAAVGLVTPSGRVPGLGVMLKEMWSKINKHRSSWAFCKSVNLAMAPGYLDVVKNPIGEGLVDERDSSLRNSSFSAVSKAGIAVFVRSGKDLRGIQNRLDGDVVHYTSVDMLHDDMVLMCRNAMLFNDKDTDFYR
eukprot:jgi/Undpi1/11318/HiC_scaffold_30.g13616.m1